MKVRITRQENIDFFQCQADEVIEISLHGYVSAVVASEIGNSHIEACKAQAVAARTFAAVKNWSVTDSSATDQAFRAKRYDSTLYQNAIDAEIATSEEILTYKGKPISAVYSACNGGKTVSAKTRWGSERAYLPEQDDPWDDSTKRTGHGVGMSQRGAKAMAAAGKTYREILAFYYPGTELIKMEENHSNSDVVSGGTHMVSAKQFVEKVKIPLEEGWGYIYGESGRLWTKELQARMNKTTEEKYAKSRKYGAKWIGKKVTDCSGLIYKALLELGEKTTHHAWYLYTDFSKPKGGLVNGKRDDGNDILPGTLVFIKGKQEHIHHVGVYVGNDICIEAKGVEYGVVTSPLSHWEYWGELKCVDYGYNDISKITVVGVSDRMKATVNNPGKKLNVRSNTGTEYPALFQLKKGDVVEVIDATEKDWWQIQYNGRIGWVYARYLVPEAVTEQKEELPFEPAKFDKTQLDNVIQLMKASINALYDELDRLIEMVNKM